MSQGRVAVMIPKKGWSVYGSEGGPFHDPRGNRMLVDALRERLKPEIRLEEVDAHINDDSFIEHCIDTLVTFMEAGEHGR
ncbi:MAG: Tm-1-like ATP-binding domain-containing protein [Deltaproteobacteria bacterium]|nr:Tm-1-like ATP-binding domain-containing protein [Deltaproteobacteria bacterium]MBW2136949.1 Tm-1-like ATP-binding domain-containing protein [Deltaproteobacteria bacterium]